MYIAEVLICVFQSTKSGPGLGQRVEDIVGPHWGCGVIIDGQGSNTADVSADPEVIESYVTHLAR